MTNKYKESAHPDRTVSEEAPKGFGEAIPAESHSQDADRKSHKRHPHSEK